MAVWVFIFLESMAVSTTNNKAMPKRIISRPKKTPAIDAIKKHAKPDPHEKISYCDSSYDYSDEDGVNIMDLDRNSLYVDYGNELDREEWNEEWSTTALAIVLKYFSKYKTSKHYKNMTSVEHWTTIFHHYGKDRILQFFPKASPALMAETVHIMEQKLASLPPVYVNYKAQFLTYDRLSFEDIKIIQLMFADVYNVSLP